MQLSLLSVNLTVFILVACAIESDSFDDVSILSNSNEKPGLTSSDASDGDYESNFDLSFDKDSSCPEKFDRLVDNRRVRRGKSICPSRKPSNSNVNNKPQPVNPTTHGKPVTDETPLMPLERNNEICSFGDMIGPGQVGPGYLVCDSGVPEDRDGQSYLYNSAYVDTLRNCRQYSFVDTCFAPRKLWCCLTVTQDRRNSGRWAHVCHHCYPVRTSYGQ